MIVNRVINKPVEEPVSLREMREQIGITRSDDTSRDLIIESRIRSAREWCEHYTNLKFLTQTLCLYSSMFLPVFNLIGPVQNVVSVKYLDTDEIEQTLDPSFYYVDDVRSKLHLRHNKSYPDVYDHPNAVYVEYMVGKDVIDDIDESVKEAIKFIVGHWENYQSTIEAGSIVRTVPWAVKQLLQPLIDYREDI